MGQAGVEKGRIQILTEEQCSPGWGKQVSNRVSSDTGEQCSPGWVKQV